MNASECITPFHLGRQALIYIRQSSPRQTLTNQESLKLQYALRQRAQEHGWMPNAIDVLDTDLGRTGRTTEGRQGFKELVARVSLGQDSTVEIDDHAPAWPRERRVILSTRPLIRGHHEGEILNGPRPVEERPPVKRRRRAPGIHVRRHADQDLRPL